LINAIRKQLLGLTCFGGLTYGDAGNQGADSLGRIKITLNSSGFCYCIESEGVDEDSGVRIPAHDPK